jgi:ABC-2 type transport system ATP-binding protein
MISCDGLVKVYGTHRAVDGVSLSVREGTICAFLGPNGAGKSTMVKLLTGIVRPTSGSAVIAGIPVAEKPLEVKRLIGVLPESLGLFDSLTVQEHLLLSGRVYGIAEDLVRSRSEDLIEVLGLDVARNRFLDQCSHGTRKKTSLAMALVHNPRVLFLDEPFEGIDPVTAKTIRDMMTTAAGHGVTVFLTSHILEIVEQIATQIVMIRQGRLVWNSATEDVPGTLESLYFELVEPPSTEGLPWLGSRQS